MTQDTELNALLLDSLDSFCRDWRAQHPLPNDGVDNPPRPLDNSLWEAMAELGWLGLALPESLGGAGLGAAEATVIAGGLGRWLLPAPYVPCALLPSVVLARCATAPLAAGLAARLAAGEEALTLAWQEQPGQLDAAASTATRWVDGLLDGVKLFVADPSADGTLLVLARDGAGDPLLAAVPANAPGVTLDRQAAGQGSLATVVFARVPVTPDQVLSSGEAALAAMDAALASGRIAMGAWLSGVASSCLDKTLGHLRDRQQFGKPLAAFQALRHRCVDLRIALELANASWRHALDAFQRDPADTATLAAIAAAKARCADTALAVAREAIQMHGAMGFVEEGGVGHYLRAALFGAAWLGGAQRQRRAFMAAQTLDLTPADGAPALDPAMSVAPDEDINALPDAVFRGRFRAFLEAHYPADLRQDHLRPFRRMNGAETRRWMSLVHRHGWRAPEWPRQYGGLGLSFRKQRIYNDEMERIGVARMIDNGVTQLGPTLMKYGSEAQKQHYLPRILACEDYWAQGYSEPNAGSDLASLKTRAVREGDHFVVNGQKIWTTLAMEATHCYALVRTGNYDRKQQGISFLLIDLGLPGVEIRPIRHIAGEEELCEVFFTDVKVPADNLVGPLDEGWTVAKALLGHERIWLASPNLAIKAMMLAERLVVATGCMGDSGVMDRLARLATDLHDYRQWYEAICRRVEGGEQIGPEASALKVYITELTQRITEFNLELGEDFAAIAAPVTLGDTRTDLYWQYAMARPGTIYAGCNEVQRDILAKSVLGFRSDV
ncbi:MAG: acyl-CoA dehydrogenase [Pseudomonadota bacterium]|nr:acyl-CoA dehydrogenase [Pseudomonadota bacterium]